jgi:hypothetical protein
MKILEKGPGAFQGEEKAPVQTRRYESSTSGSPRFAAVLWLTLLARIYGSQIITDFRAASLIGTHWNSHN